MNTLFKLSSNIIIYAETITSRWINWDHVTEVQESFNHQSYDYSPITIAILQGQATTI